MRFFIACLLLFAVLLNPAKAAELKIVASIAPLHSLAASVMHGIAEPQLLLEASLSPHSISLQPSHARMLAEADLVIWVGEELEPFLARPLTQLSARRQLALMHAQGVQLYPWREHREVATEQDQDHEEDDHSREHDHDHEEDEHSHEHEHENEDPHIWLSPTNARAILAAIAARLSEIDPANAAHYKSNASAASAVIQKKQDEIKFRLAPYAQARFIVFHDGYQYFERSFGLATSGVISLHPESPPGAKRIAAIRSALQHEEIACVFSEPQFSQRLTSRLVQGTPTRVGLLDPIGAKLTPGRLLYLQLIDNLAASFISCLSGREN